jgi:hypothetical protein
VAKIATVGSEFSGVPVVLTAGIQYTDPNSVRFEKSLQFAEIARDEGVPAVFVDSSPEEAPVARPDWESTWVADAHRATGATVLRADIPGIATQRQLGVSFAVAHGAEKVVGTESEKPLIPLFAGKFALALDSADVLVIGRMSAAENSLPPVQQRTERLAGWILAETLDMPEDSLAGPRGFTVAGAETLMDYPATQPGLNNWLYLYMSVLAARARGLQVGGVKANFIYPESMVEEETGNDVFDKKRLDQFHLQLGALIPRALGRTDAQPRAQDIALITDAHLPLLDPELDMPDRVASLGLFEDRMAENYGYQLPEWLKAV